jgi:hydroxymethylpyrimidine/phosphomethylpyrimidine kinase
MTPIVALTIAGSDSGGGAGVQADLKTFAAHRIHGTSAVTAVTAQNTKEVRAVTVLEPQFVVEQIETVLDDFEVAAAKTGMLANAPIVHAVAEVVRRRAVPNLVVDPVLVSSTGHRLMDDGGVEAYRAFLLPLAHVATPNLREAAILTGRPLAELASVEAMAGAALELRALGARRVVVKGGHLGATRTPGRTDDGSPDVVAGPDGITVLAAGRVPTGNDHGTGCSLSAAIAANLALGLDPLEAVERAKDYVHRGLAAAADWRLGGGHGPIAHFDWTPDPER